MFDSSHQIDHAVEPRQNRGAMQIDAPGTFAEQIEERELIAVLVSGGLNPQELAGLPFDQAAELLAQSEISPEILADQQVVDYITSLMGRDVR